MRYALLVFIALPFNLIGQQVDWLVAEPVGWELNPAFSSHHLSRSASGDLWSARQDEAALNYSISIFGTIALEHIDPTDGEVLHQCMLGDSVLVDAVTTGDDGTFYVGGRFMNTLNICNGSTLSVIENGPFEHNMFLLAIDVAGNVLWVKNKTLDHPGQDEIQALSVDPTGILWYATSDFFAAEITMVDDEGNDVTSWPIANGKVIGGMDHDPAGGLFVSGATGSGSDLVFGGMSIPVTETYAMFVLRFQQDGTGHWAKLAHDETFQSPMIVCDGAGSAYMAGGLIDETDFDQVHFDGPAWGEMLFLLKLDNAGNILWGLQPEMAPGTFGDIARADNATIALNNNSVLLTGTVRGQMNWNDNVNSNSTATTERTQTIVSISFDGVPQWAITGQPSQSFISSQAIAAGNDGSVHFAAHTNSSYAMAPHVIPPGDQQWVLGRIGGISTSIDDVVERSDVSIWPNPASDQLWMAAPGIMGEAVVLLDAAGRSVLTTNVTGLPQMLDLQGIRAGTYIVQAGTSRTRIVKH
jgi:hypothetical protein